jgi:hypothetical protein
MLSLCRIGDTASERESTLIQIWKLEIEGALESIRFSQIASAGAWGSSEKLFTFKVEANPFITFDSQFFSTSYPKI